MKIFDEFCKYLNQITSINYGYISVIFYTLLVLLLFYLIKKIGKICINKKMEGRTEFFFNQRFSAFINIIEFIILIFVWSDYLKNLVTLISVVSAALTIALREIIVNFFCGIFIKTKKPFKVEDRIEIDCVKGDVMNISLFNFEILEVSNKEENGQSTGIVIAYPNSTVINTSVKNITKGFKYVWNELIIKVKLDCDLAENKKCIYKIINSVETITSIPKKMKQQIKEINVENRVYFNKYEPIIYTRIVDDHIELIVRYLMHPKKARYVESVLWNKIFLAYKDGNIDLYPGIDKKDKK